MSNNLSFEWLKSAAKIEYDKGFTPAFYKEMGNVFKDHMDKYVPWDTKNTTNYHLAKMVQVRPTKSGATIVYSMAYASRHYYGIGINEENRDRKTHPLATSYWDEECWTNEKMEITKEIDTLRKRYANG